MTSDRGRGDRPNTNRPYPPPASPWLIAMDWADLLFMHWRVDSAQLRPFVPPALEIETLDGSAWLGIVPFEMCATRACMTPPLPGVSRFCELNVRTYVRPAKRDAPPGGGGADADADSAGPDSGAGVWFFSLDAASRIAVEAARRTFSLSYFRAAMSITRAADGWITYEHRRADSNRRILFGTPRDDQAHFSARYRPVGSIASAEPGSLDCFLTDRYRLYAFRPGRDADGGGRLIVGEIHHPPWPLQPAEAEIRSNTMAKWLGIDLPPGEPLLHFSRHVKVAGWRPRRAPAL